MYTTISLDQWNGESITPLTVAYNERFVDAHDMNFTVPERFAPMFDIGQVVLLSWDTNKEFLVKGIAVDDHTCSITTLSTEQVLIDRPAVPNIMSTDWHEAEYPDGWFFGDDLNDIADLNVRDVLQEFWNITTQWYQNSQYAIPGIVDAVSLLESNFGTEVSGKLAYYLVDGSIMDNVKNLLNLSTNRLRLTTSREDHSNGHTITFGTEVCRDRVVEILVDNYRTDVKTIKTNIDVSDTPDMVFRSDRDNVFRSRIHTPKKSYVTFEHIKASGDDDLSDLELDKARLNDLVYSPYDSVSGGYTVEFEFHGNMDLTNIRPGDTLTVNSNHPRPSWIPEELMISEIVRTLDHTGFREYPTLVTPPASINRDLATTTTIKNTLQVFPGN